MSYDYNELVNLFSSNPSEAIKKCQDIICSATNFDTYQDFYSYHLDNAHISTCQHEWSTPELCIFCRDCALADNSCVCLSCFLNGNHEGHHYVVHSGTNGNCDCGDLTQWKRSGFCSKHHGLDDSNINPQDYLDKELQVLLIDVIFKAAFSSLSKFTNINTENAISIIQFASSFLKFGDGFRRLIAISLTEKIDLLSLMNGIMNYSKDFNQALEQFFGGLINDQLFLKNFSKISYSILNDSIFKDTPSIMVRGSDNITYEVWNEFWFHCFQTKIIEYNIDHKNLDWVDFFSTNLAYMKESLSYIGTQFYNDFPNSLIIISARVSDAANYRPNEETQNFFDKMVTQVLNSGSSRGAKQGNKNDNIIMVSFKDITEQRHYLPVIHFILFFYNIIDAFKNKPNLKLDKLFETLDANLDISHIFYAGRNSICNLDGKKNENDKFVLNFLNQKDIDSTIPPSNYQSFHNGGAFFLNHPLVDSLAYIFRSDSLSQIKIAKILSTEKYLSLRIRLGITIMKTIASYISHRQSIASAKNKGLMLIYDAFNKPTMASYLFTKFIPLFQALIGIKTTEKTMNDEFCLKEFFAFEFAREFGLFDDFSSHDYDDENVVEKIKQMWFSFLYVSLLLVVERSLFHYNGSKFVEEQIIYALKSGVHSINQLNQLYDNKVFESWSHIWGFNDVLMKVATTNSNNNNDNNGNDQEPQDSPKSFQKDVSFYLKDDVVWNPISAINSINGQMTLMNNEISKKADELLKIPEFESEETFFFPTNPTNNNENNNDNDNDNHDLNADGLRINLKQFLMTPTVLAIVYHILRVSAGIDSHSSDLNDHLAMNILILIAKFIKEDNKDLQAAPIKVTEISYNNLLDLINQLKTQIFKYHVEKKENLMTRFFKFFTKSNEMADERAFIENTLNEQNFIALLNIKFSFNKLPPKSLIEVLLDKGKLGHEVLNKISSHIHLDCIDKNQENTEQDVKQMKHMKAAKLKEEIMNQYKTMISNYSTSNQLRQSGTDSMDDIGSISYSEPLPIDNEVCSICSTYKKNEIFSYPLYIYRTKFPFIIDKPPQFNKEEVSKEKAVDDNLGDIDIDIKIDEENNDEKKKSEEEEENNDNDNNIDPDEVLSILISRYPQLVQTEGLSEQERQERQNTLMLLLNQILEHHNNQQQSRKKMLNFKKMFKKQQIEENKEYKISKENQQYVRCTAGSNFVIQFGICQHPVHSNCVKDSIFSCPIDRSVKNGLLPSIDSIPRSVIFKDLKTFETNNLENTLGESAIKTISNFIDKFTSFFNNSPINVFVELIKSIGGLISTYEIRLRSLPDCLDSEKTKILSRNLFLTAWYAYRIQKKPKIQLPDNEDVDVESRMTVFQRFIKRLIENDDIFDDDKLNLNEIVSSIIQSKDDLKEKELCLFLRRVCLAEFFLLDKEVDSSSELTNIIDWDEILSPGNLADRYKVNFTSIDVSKGEDFEFKPFSFINLPKEFLRLNDKPFDLPVKKISEILLFNISDYNYLINNYDEISGEIIHVDDESEIKKNKKNLESCEEQMIGHFFNEFYGSKHFPSVILLVGKYASRLFIIDQQFFTVVNTFYLDKYGCEDVGYKRSQPLFLNEERYERFTDMLLSGDFTNSLIPLTRLMD